MEVVINSKKVGSQANIDQNTSNQINSEITSFLSIRKSSRKTKSKVQAERLSAIQKEIRSQKEHGVQARVIPDKGRGIFATKSFQRGDFVAEYAGDLIDMFEASYREKLYAAKDNTGSSYMYYFKFKENALW